MLDTPGITSKEGAIDAGATLSTVDYHIPLCLASNEGNYYVAYIGASRKVVGDPRFLYQRSGLNSP